MKHLFLIFIVLATLCRASAVTSYNPNDWPRFTLRDVYDAGIRPWLSPGSETSFLSFKYARVTVQTHEGVVLPEFPVEYADVYCLPDGRLRHVDMISPPQPFASARALLLPWFPKIGKSETQLDEFFKIVKENQIGYEDPNFGKAPDGFGGGWVDAGKTAYGIGFRNNKNPNLPFRVFLGVDWNKLLSERDRGTMHVEPIKPPLGYENESMVPPKKWGPDSTLDKMRALDLDTGEPPEAVAEQRRNGERPPLKSDVPTSPPTPTKLATTSPQSQGIPVKEPQAESTLIWPWLVGLVALLMTMWAGCKRRP
jgi:hypothetical protein